MEILWHCISFLKCTNLALVSFTQMCIWSVSSQESVHWIFPDWVLFPSYHIIKICRNIQISPKDLLVRFFNSMFDLVKRSSYVLFLKDKKIFLVIVIIGSHFLADRNSLVWRFWHSGSTSHMCRVDSLRYRLDIYLVIGNVFLRLCLSVEFK